MSLLHSSLVTSGAARAILDASREEVEGMVDEGKLNWVFSFACQGSRCELLRFWLLELQNPQAVRGLTLEAALRRIIPFDHRARLKATEVSRLLDMPHPCTWKRIKRGTWEVERSKAGCWWVSIPSLKSWLSRSWLGASSLPSGRN